MQNSSKIAEKLRSLLFWSLTWSYALFIRGSSFQKFKSDAPKVPKQAEAKKDVIKPQNDNYKNKNASVNDYGRHPWWRISPEKMVKDEYSIPVKGGRKVR